MICEAELEYIMDPLKKMNMKSNGIKMINDISIRKETLVKLLIPYYERYCINGTKKYL